MKKKFPPKATLPEDKATATTAKAINSFFTATPKPVAVCSPRFKVFKIRDL